MLQTIKALEREIVASRERMAQVVAVWTNAIKTNDREACRARERDICSIVANLVTLTGCEAELVDNARRFGFAEAADRVEARPHLEEIATQGAKK